MSNFISSKNKFGCSICLKSLKDPAILSCNHMYCLPCVQNRQPSKCPSCSKSYIPRELEVNAALNGLLKDLAKDNLLRGNSDVRICEVCDKAFASKYCSTCNGYFCDGCLSTIHNNPVMKKHGVVDASTAIIYPACSVHSNKNVEYYCNTCNVLVCCGCSKRS